MSWDCVISWLSTLTVILLVFPIFKANVSWESSRVDKSTLTVNTALFAPSRDTITSVEPLLIDVIIPVSTVAIASSTGV